MLRFFAAVVTFVFLCACSVEGRASDDSAKKTADTGVSIDPAGDSKVDTTQISTAAPKSKAPQPTEAQLAVAERLQDRRLREEYLSADPFIKGIVEEHERTFPGALRHGFLYYYTSLKRLSRVQQGVLHDLMKRPEFRRDFEAREPLTDIKISVAAANPNGEANEGEGQQSEDTQATNMDPQAKVKTKDPWTKFKEETLAQIPFEPTVTAEEVIELLRHNLISTMEQTPYSLPLREREPMWIDMARYTIMATILRQNPGMTAAQLLERFAGVDLGALDYLDDAGSFAPIFREFRERGRLGPLSESWIKSIDWQLWQAARLLEEQSGEVFAKTARAALTPGNFVTLREVHPNCAIFRGYVGNDCATSYSPGFVFTPFDRYFYVYGANGVALGYSGLSLVNINGERAVYLHTIQGPDFTSEQTELVMRGMQKAAAQIYGARRVVLGRDANIHANMNFPQITRAMLDAVRGADELPVEWLDVEYRRVIHHWESTMTYDDPERNRFGRALRFEPEQVSVEIKQRPFVPKFSRRLARIKDLRCERSLRGI